MNIQLENNLKILYFSQIFILLAFCKETYFSSLKKLYFLDQL